MYTRCPYPQTRTPTSVRWRIPSKLYLTDPSIRPQTRDLESRLRNLEHLISSIPGGSAAASSSLSLGELDQIRIAAFTTPSDSSPSDRWIDGAGGSFKQEPGLGSPWVSAGHGGYVEHDWMQGVGVPSGSGSGQVMPPLVTYRSPSMSGQDLLYKYVLKTLSADGSGMPRAKPSGSDRLGDHILSLE